MLTYGNERSKVLPKVVLVLCLCLVTQAYTCASVEKWVGVVLNAVQTVGPLVSPFVGSIASLLGKTLNAVQINAINSKLNLATADLTALQAGLQAITGTPDQTTLGKLNALEVSVEQNLNAALLQANGIQDAATRNQIVASIQVFIDTAQKIQALIPTAVVAGRPQMRRQLSKAEVQTLTDQLKPAAIRARFNASIKPTGNVAVDAAFAGARAK